MGESLNVLKEPVRVQSLDDPDDLGMESPPLLLEEALVGHIVRQRVLESVLEIGKKLGFIEELSRLQVSQRQPNVLIAQLRDSLEQRERDVFADH